jgi:ferredoxin
MPTVKFYFENKAVEVGEHANLRRVALLHKVPIYEGLATVMNCMGNGLCSTCAVEVLEGMENLTPPGGIEKMQLKGFSPTLRLACQAEIVKGSVTLITRPRIEKPAEQKAAAG